jgi:Spy/CpxP family protein refolding chaperone
MMKRLNFSALFVLAILLTCSFVTVKAQEDAPNAQTDTQQNRPRLLAALGLTPDQIQQIRRINQENRPQLRAANQRLREANRSLDTAVYSDVADEADIQNKIKEVHAAHNEMINLRAKTEFAVRKVLTPAQLSKFREIRQQSLADKENVPRLRNNQRMNVPNRPLSNRLRRNRPLN